MEEEEVPREAGRDIMSETVILDEVKYDLFRRILASFIAAPRAVDNPVAAAQILTGQAYEALTDSGVIRKNPPPMTFIGWDPKPVKPDEDKCGVCGITRAMDPSPRWQSVSEKLLCPTCVLFSTRTPSPAKTSFLPEGSYSFGVAPKVRNIDAGCMICGQSWDNAPAPGSLVMAEAGEVRCRGCYQLLPEPKEAQPTA
jgi:hypothetical protein